MPIVFDLTDSPQNLSSVLSDGCHIAQNQSSWLVYYAAIPASDPDPTDNNAMFLVEPAGYFVINVGSSFHAVWVVGVDIAGPANIGKLVVMEADA